MVFVHDILGSSAPWPKISGMHHHICEMAWFRAPISTMILGTSCVKNVSPDHIYKPCVNGCMGHANHICAQLIIG